MSFEILKLFNDKFSWDSFISGVIHLYIQVRWEKLDGSGPTENLEGFF